MPPATDLARRFAEAITALRAIHDFDDWIGQYWSDRCPAPESSLIANHQRGADDAIIWHEGETTIYGLLPGRDGCFCVPRDAALPDFAFAAGRTPARFEQDILISAAMREEHHTPSA